jgi:hypothetical protein
MAIPSQTSVQLTSEYARLGCSQRQAKSTHAERAPGQSPAGGAAPSPKRREASPFGLASPGPRGPASAPGSNSPRGELPYCAGFLNSSSASVGFSVTLVTVLSMTGLSSASVFVLCGHCTAPTGFQSP